MGKCQCADFRGLIVDEATLKRIRRHAGGNICTLCILHSLLWATAMPPFVGGALLGMSGCSREKVSFFSENFFADLLASHEKTDLTGSC